MKKALTSIVATAALLTLVAPAAEARSLPTKHLHAKVAKKAERYPARRVGMFVPSGLICPEQQLGDSWGYCYLPTPASDSSVTNVTYNDTEGT